MNLKELENLVRKGESDRLEFKRSTGQRTQAAKAVCAMLNGLGGFVIFGVTDKGKIVGQTVTPKTLEDVVNELREIEPPAFPDVETIVLPSGAPSLFFTYREAVACTISRAVPTFEAALLPCPSPAPNTAAD